MNRPATELLDDEMWMETGDGEIPVSLYWPFDVLLAVRLFHTEFEYGTLSIGEMVDPTEHGLDWPSGSGDYARMVRELPVVFHPNRGALVVGAIYPDDYGDHADERLRSRYDELMEDIQLMMSDLVSTPSAFGELHPYWSEVDIAVGPAVLVFGDAGLDAFDESIPECVVEVDDWSDVPAILGRLMDRYEAAAESDFSDYAKHLRSALYTATGVGGSFTDHVTYVSLFDDIAGWLWSPEQMMSS